MNKPCRVLMVMDSLSVGGTETHVLSLIKGLRRKGVALLYAGAGGQMYDAFAAEGCQVYAVDLTPGALMKPSAKEAAIRSLRQIMRNKRIDVVHVHQTPSGNYAAEAAKELGIPVVFTIHGAYYSYDQLQEMASLCSRLISVSKPVQTFLAQMNIASELVPNGIDLRQFAPAEPQAALREKLGIAGGDPVIVYASRLAWDKAVVCSMLIQAVHRLRQEGMPRLNLIVVGGGNQFEEIRELAHTVQAGSAEPFIHMMGSQASVGAYFAASDLVVGTGRVALEAMACAKPVLAVGNHGFFGFVEPAVYEQAWAYYFGDHNSVRPPSEPLMAEELRKALGRKEELPEIGRQGRLWMERAFDIHMISEEMERIYRSVLR